MSINEINNAQDRNKDRLVKETHSRIEKKGIDEENNKLGEKSKNTI